MNRNVPVFLSDELQAWITSLVDFQCGPLISPGTQAGPKNLSNHSEGAGTMIYNMGPTAAQLLSYGPPSIANQAQQYSILPVSAPRAPLCY